MSQAPRPNSRSPSSLPDHGSSSHVARSPGGTTSTCPTSTIRRPPRPVRAARARSAAGRAASPRRAIPGRRGPRPGPARAAPRAAPASASSPAIRSWTAPSSPVMLTVRTSEVSASIAQPPSTASIAARSTRRERHAVAPTSRQIGRVMHVGPPEPLTPISVAGIRMDLDAVRRRVDAAILGLPSAMITTPGRTDQDVVAAGRPPRRVDLDQPVAEVLQQLPQPDRQERQVRRRRGRRRSGGSATSGGRGRRSPGGTGTSNMRTSPPTSVASWSAPAWFVRSVRPITNRSGRSQIVSPPSIVPGRLDPPDRRDAVGQRPGLDRRRLDLPVRLARSQRDRAAVGDQERVEGVQQVRAVDLRLEQVDGRAERGRGARRTPRARAWRPRGRQGGGSRARDRRRPARTRVPAP